MSFIPEPFVWNYCPICADKLEIRDDGQGSRPHCGRCRRFYYSNPVPASCCFVTGEAGLLLVQRAIEPCLGEWTLPGGFVELEETTEEAALRELEEETGLRGFGVRLIGASTQPSQLQGAVTVLGYVVTKWEGTPVAKTDAKAVGFFPKEARPPLAFQAHRELIKVYDELRERGEI